MKKIVKLFGVMTIAAALLISCKPSPNDDPTNPDEGKPDSGTNSEAPATPGNPGNDATGGNGGEGSGGAAEAKPVFTMTYDAEKQWAAPTFTVDSDWVKLDVEFDKDYSEVIQFCCISDKVEKEESWGTQYYSCYPGATVKTSIDIAAVLDLKNNQGATLKDNGATKIEKISIQNKTKDAQTVNVLSAKVTKADGSVIDVVPEGDWGSKVTKK